MFLYTSNENQINNYKSIILHNNNNNIIIHLHIKRIKSSVYYTQKNRTYIINEHFN